MIEDYRNPGESAEAVESYDFGKLAKLAGFLTEAKSERYRAIILEHNAPRFVVGLVNALDGDARTGVVRALNSSPFQVKFQPLAQEAFDRIRLHIYKPETQAGQERHDQVGQSQITKQWGGGSGAIGDVVSDGQLDEKLRYDTEDANFGEDDEWIDLTDSSEYERNIRRNEFDLKIQEFLRLMLTEFLRSGASDLHVEGGKPLGQIRMRLDGEMFTRWDNIPFEWIQRVVWGLSEMAGRAASEMRDKDVNSTIKVKFMRDGVPADIELRFNSQPTLDCPTITIRSQRKPIRDLLLVGFNERQISDIEIGYSQPRGIITVTGATGSGKTNTLESIYARLEEPNIYKIIEIAEPIEIRSRRRRQISLRRNSGFTWWDAFHSSLRADPDILGLGELQSAEHAALAINAALTGHLVLATYHAATIEDTLTRLFQMGIPRDNLATGLNLVLAQKLVKKLCVCKTLDEARSTVYGAPVYKAVGCQICFNKGVIGRTAIAETLLFDDEVQDWVQNRNFSARDVIKKAIEADKMIPMKKIARDKVLAGDISELQVTGALGMALSELSGLPVGATVSVNNLGNIGQPVRDIDGLALDA